MNTTEAHSTPLAALIARLGPVASSIGAQGAGIRASTTTATASDFPSIPEGQALAASLNRAIGNLSQIAGMLGTATTKLQAGIQGACIDYGHSDVDNSVALRALTSSSGDRS